VSKLIAVLGIGAIIRKNGSLFNLDCRDVPRSPQVCPTHTFRLVDERMTEGERHNPDQRHNDSSVVVKLVSVLCLRLACTTQPGKTQRLSKSHRGFARK
jgi:hypothetical protein